MKDTIVIYDRTQRETEAMGPNAAMHFDGEAIGIDKIADLENVFDRLSRRPIKIASMLFYTHGVAAQIQIGTALLNAGNVKGRFANKGFEKMFAPGAEILFVGCEVAANDEAAYYDPAKNGLAYLMTWAEIFLSAGAGRVGGFHTKGWVNWRGIGESLWGKPWHVWRLGESTPYYAYVSKGGRRTRFSAGAEMWTPIGIWLVEVNKKKLFYEFTTSNKVIASPAGERGDATYGTWSRKNGLLEINWATAEVELWDMPLHEGYQSGLRGSSKMEIYARFRPANAYLRSE